MSSDRETHRLAHIIDNGEEIARYIASMSVETFIADRKTVNAVERCLERIIEAAIKIGPDRMAAILPTLELHTLRAMGNLLRHSYDLVDLRTIYTTAVRRVPELVDAARRALVERD